jgi:hypothetical protein
MTCRQRPQAVSLAPLLLLLILIGCAAPSARVTIRPVEDPNAALHNPDMGWVIYENYPVDPRENGSSNLVTLPDENFDCVDNVAVMFAWSDVEPASGRYDFTDVDRAYDYWKRRGKRIQLRMSTESLLWWNTSTPPRGLGIPRHVLDRLPAEKKQTRTLSGVRYDVADARDPAYLDALDKFLAAVAKHFRGERAVTLIDLRGFGVWGEWHSGYRYPTVDDRHAALSTMIDHFSAAFPDQTLALSASHDPDGPAEYFTGPTNRVEPAATRHYDDFVRYSAFDRAMAKPNVTFRRDGVGGAVYSNQRKLIGDAFATLAKGPITCEFIQSYSEAKTAGEPWIKALIDDALSLHPNYINLIGWQAGDALNFLREQPEMVAYGLRNMGYRLMPTSFTYPTSIRSGETFRIESTWENRAVGRAMRDLDLVVSIADKAGKFVRSLDAGATGANKWVKGRSYVVVKDLNLARLSAGRYQLRIALIDPADRTPVRLPLREMKADGSYPVGTIDVAR